MNTVIPMNKFVKVRADIDKSTKKQIKTILRKYKYSQDKLVNEVSAIILKNLDDSGVIVLSPDLVIEVKKSVKDNLDSLVDYQIDFVTDIVEDCYTTAVDKTAKLIGMKTDFSLVRKEMIDRAVNSPINGKRFSERIWENTNDLANRIYNDVIDCVKNGEQPKRIIKRIKDDYGVSSYQAKRLVNTEVARVVNAGQMDVYHNSGVVDTVLYTATLEDNTCDTCADLDGKTFKLNDAPNIPQHPNCRCCLVPVVDDWEPTKRADNQTKETINYMTYGDWEHTL